MGRIRGRFCLSMVLAFVMLATMTAPAFAADAKIVKVDKIEDAWTQSSEMVDWAGAEYEWVMSWVEHWLRRAGATTEEEKAKALYTIAVDAADYNTSLLDKKVHYKGNVVQVRNIPSIDLGDYVPQKTFLECMREVVRYTADENSAKPKWLCGDYARFYIGLLRAAGLAAYMEVGVTAGSSQYHGRVAVILPSTKTAFFCDPCFGSADSNPWKYYKMIPSVYNRNGTYAVLYVSSEKMPSRRLIEESDTVETIKPAAAKMKIDIPAADRYSNILVPIRVNGELTTTVSMSAIRYGGTWYFAVRDVCMILSKTEKSVGIDTTASGTMGTIAFTRDTYQLDGSETNWTDGKAQTVSKTAQAYLKPNAWFGGEQTDIKVIFIENKNYVNLVEVARMMDFAGTTASAKEFGLSFTIK